MQPEIQFRTAVAEAGLVDGITLVAERMIDGNGFFETLFALLDDEVAFKGPGLPAGVVFHPELLK